LRYSYGDVYCTVLQYNLGGGVLVQGVNECPESVHLLQSWAMLEHKSGNQEKACMLFERGMSLDPGNPYIAHAWGQLERKRGEYAKARTLYLDSLRLYGPWAQVSHRSCHLSHFGHRVWILPLEGRVGRYRVVLHGDGSGLVCGAGVRGAG
jgi:tetratricopeptide (TPR) repeat protein